MEPLLELFRQHLGSEKRSSAHTLRAYLGDLDELFAHARSLRAGDAAQALTPGDLSTSVWSLVSGQSARPQRSAHRGPQAVGHEDFLPAAGATQSWLAGSPVAGLRGPKRRPHLPAFLGKDEASRLLESTGDDAVQATECARDQALLEVLYGSGLRISECLSPGPG